MPRFPYPVEVVDGRVAEIYVAPEGGAEMRSVDHVEAVAGRGLRGDRYFDAKGTFSRRIGPPREVTLVESEAIEALAEDYGIPISPGDTRRNLVTQGVPLNHLVGRSFRVGEVTLEGVKLCEPCGRLEKLTREGVKAGLVHRGGLRARIVSGGVIRKGDIVTIDTEV